MTPFDETAVFGKVDKLQKPSTPASRRVRLDAPEALSADWDELVETLMKKGVKTEK